MMMMNERSNRITSAKRDVESVTSSKEREEEECMIAILSPFLKSYTYVIPNDEMSIHMALINKSNFSLIIYNERKSAITS